uniref:Uncharacterized protein n=1 Tax=Romanomermis culicivorax TaxID=13658 RepID=A0A915HPJ0_ROMCU
MSRFFKRGKINHLINLLYNTDLFKTQRSSGRMLGSPLVSYQHNIEVFNNESNENLWQVGEDDRYGNYLRSLKMYDDDPKI